MITHEHQIRIRYADTDKMGVVYNGNYLRFFEIGRTELLRAIGLPYVELEEEGIQLPLLESHVEYLKPARYDDMISVVTSYEHERTAVITLKYEIELHGDTLARGYTRHSFVNATTFRPIRPPSRFVEAVAMATEQQE